ncbi:hypothetical protein D8S78_10780 [Natrialba swarupiae]|nr:hypothetical protein [Natrialba swarupiae]
MSRERSRTVSVGLDERGQTTQDFVVGLGLFVLAVAFVFMTVPNFIATPTGSIDGGSRSRRPSCGDDRRRHRNGNTERTRREGHPRIRQR